MSLKITENSVKIACISWLEINGLQPIRNNTGTFTKKYKSKAGYATEHWIKSGLVGSGDILCCTKSGRWLEIECKSSTGKQQPEQKERQVYINRLGGIYILAYSVDDLEVNKHLIL